MLRECKVHGLPYIRFDFGNGGGGLRRIARQTHLHILVHMIAIV
jgi:hypothetical protein